MKSPFSWVSLVGLLGAVGWITRCYFLVSWGGDVTMKMATCITIMLLGVSAYLTNKRSYPGACFVMNVYVATCITMAIYGGEGIEILLISEPKEWATLSTSPGVPSYGTALLAIAWAIGIQVNHINWLSMASVGLGLICLLGHATGVNWMMYHWELSSAMAIPTAVSFILMGCQQARDQIQELRMKITRGAERSAARRSG